MKKPTRHTARIVPSEGWLINDRQRRFSRRRYRRTGQKDTSVRPIAVLSCHQVSSTRGQLRCAPRAFVRSASSVTQTQCNSHRHTGLVTGPLWHIIKTLLDSDHNGKSCYCQIFAILIASTHTRPSKVNVRMGQVTKNTNASAADISIHDPAG